ncbi:hypothetical protein BB934_09445 [Microvirga ossetica]|uniref:Cadherin domain-containing protein n=2 Tax=Microvirga ossetica TaxID=1882682 RepID=A0A1B2EEL7_9HYPH|nr:hypothetical protein BB934_09445 [Microvirga ossetica]
MGSKPMAFTVVRQGNEIRVNTTGQGYQEQPSIASLGNGRWVVTWDGPGPNGPGVYQQVYTGDGVPVFAAEQRVDLAMAGSAVGQNASVQVLPDGGWIVTWTRASSGDADVFMQRFDANGSPLLPIGGPAANIQVNTLTVGRQSDSKVTILDDGWLITWKDSGGRVFQQRYNADGEPQYRNGGGNPEERRVSPDTSFAIGGTDVAALDDGAAVVWTRKANSSAAYEVVLQMLDDDGDPVLADEHVIAVATTTFTAPSIKALPNGTGFLVVWSGPDADGQGVFLQKFDAQGRAAFAQPLRINALEAGVQTEASVEVLDDGGFVVTFSSAFDVFQRRFDSDGNPQGVETPIAAWLGSEWNRQGVTAYLGEGRWVSAWSNFNQGGDENAGVAQRVFTLADTAVLTSAAEIASGTVDGETLQVRAGGLSDGDRVDGGGGNDTLEMIEAGTLDLRLPLAFAGFEIIAGSGGADTIITDLARLSGIATINGGDGNDVLQLSGADAFDLSGIAINGIERIELTDPARVTVDETQIALRMFGDVSEDEVILTTGALTLDERIQVFRQGFDKITFGGVTYTNAPPVISHLDGDGVVAAVGTSVRLDFAGNATVTEDTERFSSLSVKITNRVVGEDRLLIVATGGITLDGTTVRVDGTAIGTIVENGGGAEGLKIDFLASATADQVRTLIWAPTYQNTLSSDPDMRDRKVEVTLTDGIGATATAQVTVDIVPLGQGENAQPSITNRGPAPTGADTALLSPFANLRVSDDDDFLTVVVTFDAAKGRLVLGAKNFGTYDAAAGRYTITAHKDDITDDLRALQFNPTDRSDAIGTVHTTVFTLTATDPSNPAVTAEVTVNAVTANRAPASPVLTLSASSVAELSATGTLVGTLAATDPNQGDTVSYALIGASDAFRLNGNKLEVANGVGLDFEQARSHTFTIRATDARGLSNDSIVTVAVGDINPERTAGTAAGDRIAGGAAKDSLSGGLGNDTIFGGLGNDVLTGNGGRDFFVFNTKPNKSSNVDRVSDFSAKDDTIWLDNAVFTKIGETGTEARPAKLKADMFWTGKAAHDSSDRIIYDKATGALYYDADGTGRSAQVKIATLTKNQKVSVSDFFAI